MKRPSKKNTPAPQTRPLPEDGWVQRVEALEARLSHLEAAHEGLQDAVYRQSVLADENVDELRRRLRPGRLARDLSDDARKRGL